MTEPTLREALTAARKDNQMFDTFINQQRSEHTKVAYRKDMAKWVGFLAGREPTEGLALEWRDLLIATLSGGSALRAFTTVRSYCRWEGVDNPFSRIKSPSRTSNWTPVSPADGDVSAVLGVCRNSTDRGILVCLANGLRAQEVCDLNDTDFYHDPAYNTWILRVTGKGNKQRLVPVTTETSTALLNVRMRPGRIFRDLNPRRVRYIVDKWAEVAGVQGIHPHAFRHNYATRMIRAGIDVFSVQRLLGHTRAETTSVYVNLDLGDLVNAISRDPRNLNQTELRVAV